MSGVASSIGKVFTSVASGVSTAIGSAVSGVGAVVGTAASAGASLFGGGGGSLLSSLSGGGGILGNLLSGVVNVTTRGLGGLIDTVGSAGSTLLGPATSSIGGGMAAGAAAAGGAAPSFLEKAGSFLTSQQGAGLIGGIGKGLMEYEKMEQDAKERQKDRDYLLGKEMRIRDSYNVDKNSLPNGNNAGFVDPTQRPTPPQQYGRDFDMVYDPDLGRIVRQQR